MAVLAWVLTTSINSNCKYNGDTCQETQLATTGYSGQVGFWKIKKISIDTWLLVLYSKNKLQ